jgi:hypothetical protein
MAAVLALFIMGSAAYVFRFMINTIPDQMAKDRIAYCDKLGQLIAAIEKNTDRFDTVFDKHDAQAKEILKLNEKIDLNLSARPCARQNDTK